MTNVGSCLKRRKKSNLTHGVPHFGLIVRLNEPHWRLTALLKVYDAILITFSKGQNLLITLKNVLHPEIINLHEADPKGLKGFYLILSGCSVLFSFHDIAMRTLKTFLTWILAKHQKFCKPKSYSIRDSQHTRS